jgi:amidase
MDEYDIAELQQKMNTGELTARQLAESFLERIDSIDRDGPRLNSILETNPDALDLASSLDQERAAGHLR